jgi:hypothetical protein
MAVVYNEESGAWEESDDAQSPTLLDYLGAQEHAKTPHHSTVLFHADIVDREFGSHLLSVQKLVAWANGKGLELVTLPTLDGYQFVQAEALLSAIERAIQTNTSEKDAAAVAQSTTVLAQDRAAEIAPRWLCGADAAQQWRREIGQAVKDGELSLLESGSKLPIAAPEQHTATVAPVAEIEAAVGLPDAPVVVPASEPKQPDALPTRDIAELFDGVKYTKTNWPKRLSGTLWLDDARVSRGEVGGVTGLWCPLTLAQLVCARAEQVEKPSMFKAFNSRFKNNPALAPWRDAWRDYYDTFSDTDDGESNSGN